MRLPFVPEPDGHVPVELRPAVEDELLERRDAPELSLADELALVRGALTPRRVSSSGCPALGIHSVVAGGGGMVPARLRHEVHVSDALVV